MAQLPQKIRKAIFKRDGNQCAKCQSTIKSLHVHHIVPKVFGGTDEEENLITLCFACHEEWHAIESASTFPFYEWLATPCATSFLIWYRIASALKKTNSIDKCSAEDLFDMLEKIYSRVKENTELP